jgi:hypothetical protein
MLNLRLSDSPHFKPDVPPSRKAINRLAKDFGLVLSTSFHAQSLTWVATPTVEGAKIRRVLRLIGPMKIYDIDQKRTWEEWIGELSFILHRLNEHSKLLAELEAA